MAHEHDWIEVSGYDDLARGVVVLTCGRCGALTERPMDRNVPDDACLADPR